MQNGHVEGFNGRLLDECSNAAWFRKLLDGRANIAREDIEHVAVPALAHRIMLNYAALSDGIDAAHIVERVIKSVRAAKV